MVCVYTSYYTDDIQREYNIINKNTTMGYDLQSRHLIGLVGCFIFLHDPGHGAVVEQWHHNRKVLGSNPESMHYEPFGNAISQF